MLAYLCACEGGALEGDEGCGVYNTVVQRCGWLCSTVVFCIWGDTARLAGYARRYTPSHCEVCVEGRHGSSCTAVGESS